MAGFRDLNLHGLFATRITFQLLGLIRERFIRYTIITLIETTLIKLGDQVEISNWTAS